MALTRKALILLAAMTALACRSEARAVRALSGASAEPTVVALSSLELSSPTVKAGERVTATVTLTGAAQSPSGAVVVYVGFDGELLAGPREVSIPNGQTRATFTLQGKPVRAAGTGTISAATLSPQPYGLLTRSVTVTPRVAHPTAGPLVVLSSL